MVKCSYSIFGGGSSIIFTGFSELSKHWLSIECHRKNSLITQSTPEPTLLIWGRWTQENIPPTPGHLSSLFGKYSPTNYVHCPSFIVLYIFASIYLQELISNTCPTSVSWNETKSKLIFMIFQNHQTLQGLRVICTLIHSFIISPHLLASPVTQPLCI